ncbi:hypothetical protein DFS34DRAFT_37693 [Phlyctochytrium arcticum]|nr:hypothetical protein DFS34DRAFT_37693 [Phlyctochytrium arcticum]
MLTAYSIDAESPPSSLASDILQDETSHEKFIPEDSPCFDKTTDLSNLLLRLRKLSNELRMKQEQLRWCLDSSQGPESSTLMVLGCCQSLRKSVEDIIQLSTSSSAVQLSSKDLLKSITNFYDPISSTLRENLNDVKAIEERLPRCQVNISACTKSLKLIKEAQMESMPMPSNEKDGQPTGRTSSIWLALVLVLVLVFLRMVVPI